MSRRPGANRKTGVGPVGWVAIAGIALGAGALLWSSEENVSLAIAGRAAITGRRTTLPNSTPIGRHFTLADVASSNTATKHGINNTPTEAAVVAAKQLAEHVLDRIVEACGPIRINSWYRAPELNKLVGGSSTSAHMLGEAADIVLPGVEAPDFARLILKAGITDFDQLIGYAPDNGGQIHISWRPSGNRGQIRWSPKKKQYIPWKPLAPEGQRFS